MSSLSERLAALNRIQAPSVTEPDGDGTVTPAPQATATAVDAAADHFPQTPAPADPPARAEPVRDRFEGLKEHVHSELLQQLGPQLYDADLDAAELEAKVRVVLADVLASSNRPLTRVDRERITQDISDDILGYGPLELYLRDDDVAEVMVNGPFSIYLERSGKLVKVAGSDRLHQ